MTRADVYSLYRRIQCLLVAGTWSRVDVGVVAGDRRRILCARLALETSQIFKKRPT